MVALKIIISALCKSLLQFALFPLQSDNDYHGDQNPLPHNITAHEPPSSPADAVSRIWSEAGVKEDLVLPPGHSALSFTTNSGHTERSAPPVDVQDMLREEAPSADQGHSGLTVHTTSFDHDPQQNTTISRPGSSVHQMLEVPNSSSKYGPVFTIIGGTVGLVTIIVTISECLHRCRERGRANKGPDLELGRLGGGINPIHGHPTQYSFNFYGRLHND